MQILLWVLSVLSILFPASLFAQSPKSATISELVTYNGKDREALLYAGAKTEGTSCVTLCQQPRNADDSKDQNT
jgi:hypothetical protein